MITTLKNHPFFLYPLFIYLFIYFNSSHSLVLPITLCLRVLYIHGVYFTLNSNFERSSNWISTAPLSQESHPGQRSPSPPPSPLPSPPAPHPPQGHPDLPGRNHGSTSNTSSRPTHHHTTIVQQRTATIDIASACYYNSRWSGRPSGRPYGLIGEEGGKS